MTLRPVNSPAAGVAQRTRTGRHFSGMTRRDLAFVHLHRPIKAAHLKAIVRAALERDPDKRIPLCSRTALAICNAASTTPPGVCRTRSSGMSGSVIV
jgi:hypothetical protein